jgi:2-dehydro-3-deoxyphosphooctonate aldolase (KDO 8-P synthase)
MIYILGPCALENWDMYSKTGEYLNEIMLGKEWYYKASFDKANRTSLFSERGCGLYDGINYFKVIKEKITNLKLITDIHQPSQAKELKGVIDVVQIPAFLCRQTDLLVAAAENFDIINVKKGQWLNPYVTENIYKKIKEVNPRAEVWITERGSAFGYDRLLIDFSSVEILKKSFDKVIFDVSHSTQKFGKEDFTGGDFKLAEKYFKSAPIFGYDGVFAEVHPNPSGAISDKDSQIPLDRIDKVVYDTNKLICDILK